MRSGIRVIRELPKPWQEVGPVLIAHLVIGGIVLSIALVANSCFPTIADIWLYWIAVSVFVYAGIAGIAFWWRVPAARRSVQPTRAMTVLGFTLWVLPLGASLALLLNGLLDSSPLRERIGIMDRVREVALSEDSPPEQYATVNMGKSWRRIRVPSTSFDSRAVGRQIVVLTHEGAFEIEWIEGIRFNEERIAPRSLK